MEKKSTIVPEGTPCMSLRESGKSKWSVVLADDHTLILHAVHSWLEEAGGFEICASVADGTSALEAILAHKPDLAILDNSMPGHTGIDVAKELQRKKHTGTDIVLLTMFGHFHLAREAHRFGVGACVSKEDSTTELAHALEAVRTGTFFLSPKMAEEVAATKKESVESDLLTPREKQIVVAIAEGMTNKEIADFLGISVRTVDHHRERLMRKIDAHNAADVVRYATRMGIRLSN